MIIAVLSTACHQVTEYQGGGSSNLYIIDTGDFGIKGTVGDLSGGGTVVANGPDEVLVIGTDGVLHRIDLQTFSVDTSFSIGGSSGTGYGDASIATNGNLYCLGPGSQVIEVDLGSNTVEDNFSPGPKPGSLAANPVEGRLYFTDSEENTIGEILTSTNTTSFVSTTYYPPADVMVEPTGGRHLVAVCSNSLGSIYFIWLDLSTSARLAQIEALDPCSSVIPMTSDSLYAICCPRWGSPSGKILLVRGYEVPQELLSRSVEGHPVEMCFNGQSGESGYLSVLGRTDSGGTVLSVFALDFYHADLEQVCSMELDGIPIDLASPGDGRYIVVLTSD